MKNVTKIITEDFATTPPYPSDGFAQKKINNMLFIVRRYVFNFNKRLVLVDYLSTNVHLNKSFIEKIMLFLYFINDMFSSYNGKCSNGVLRIWEIPTNPYQKSLPIHVTNLFSIKKNLVSTHSISQQWLNSVCV